MNRIIRWAGLAVVLSALAACSNTQEIDTPIDTQPSQVVAKEGKTIHFRSGKVDTKATFDDAVERDGVVSYPAYWTDNDEAVMISLNYEYALTAGVNVSEQDDAGRIERVSFDASFSDVDAASPYRFYVVSPASALLWASADREAVSVHVLANQTPSVKSVDEKAMIIVASSDAFQELPDNVDLDFEHITSYGKLTLKNLAIPEGASLKSVTLSCEEQPLSGAWYYSFAEGTIDDKEASSSIVLNTDHIDVAGGDPIWFACAPVGASISGKALTIKASLDNGTALVRTITLNSSVNFAAGRVTKFSVNMASAETVSLSVQAEIEEEVYQLVSSVNSLNVGDEVIIVDSTSPTHAMTSTSSTSGLAATTSGFTVGGDGYIRLSSGTSVLRLTVSSKNNSSFTFSDGGSNYLNYTSSGSTRYLSWSSSSRSWTVAFPNGAASISSNNRYYFRYNNEYFSLATSSSTVAIYKKTTITTTKTVDLSDDPVCGYSEYGAYLSDRNLVYNPSTDQLSREYSDGSLTFSILAPAEDQVVEFKDIPADAKLGDQFNLSLSFISGLTIEMDSIIYPVYVVKEEGHSLWLSDAAGNGFIVKR